MAACRRDRRRRRVAGSASPAAGLRSPGWRLARTDPPALIRVAATWITLVATAVLGLRTVRASPAGFSWARRESSDCAGSPSRSSTAAHEPHVPRLTALSLFRLQVAGAAVGLPLYLADLVFRLPWAYRCGLGAVAFAAFERIDFWLENREPTVTDLVWSRGTALPRTAAPALVAAGASPGARLPRVSGRGRRQVGARSRRGSPGRARPASPRATRTPRTPGRRCCRPPATPVLPGHTPRPRRNRR